MTIPDPTLQRSSHCVRVSDLRAYLNSQGWTQQPFKRQQELMFVAPESYPVQDATLLVPASERLTDYIERVDRVVRSLSQMEERPQETVLRDILTPTCDKLNVRLQTAETRSGTLMLGFAAQFFEAVKNLLTFAACAEHDPRPYFPRAFKEAVGFASRCRLAGTAGGSFRVTLEAPLPPPASHLQQQQFIYPKERRILLGLIHGLVDARNAHDRGDVESLMNSGNHRLNANICEALLRMKPDADDAIVDIQAVWSLTWPLRDRERETSVAFDNRSLETISAIGRAFRSGAEADRKVWRGKIVKLAADNPLPKGGGSAEITIQVQNVPSSHNVALKLTIADYRRAVQAHLDGKSVEVTGVLEKCGKKATLVDPMDFQVVS